MKKSDPISILHVIFLSMTVIGLKNHVTILPPLLQVGGRDGWASVVLATLFMLPWGILLLYIHKKSNQEPIRDWLEEKIGKVSSFIFLYTTIAYLLFLASVTMRETLQFVTNTFLPETPFMFLLVIFTILCVLLATTDIQTIVMINVIVLVGVVGFGFFAAFTNFQVKDYNLLRPFFEDGFQPVIKGMIYPASGIVELIFFIFIQHKIKSRIRFSHFVVMAFILMGLTLGPLTGAITEFGPEEAAKQRFPAYEEWGLVTIGRFFEHLDFLSIYQWLTGTFIRVGLILFVVIDLLNLNKKKKKIFTFIAPVFIIICLSLFAMSDIKFVELKGKYILPITFFVFFVTSLFLAIVAFVSSKSSRKEIKQDYEEA
ncbi:endospore germination permease [Sporosarcina sp. FSL K6-6792]|uniref:endospore germination permease n=1 Tax=Sporosarcina sp. FSL K6-6792 TaxID=2921559 RepID=UPI0030F71CC7